MSVYYEAVKSGRITEDDIANAGGSIKRALKVVKRREAERRPRPPIERTGWYRRELERAARNG